ncbi:hypothetical protein ACIA4K_04025 [Lactobacillus delbrueckii subsp. bulgaricus]|uniref:hypothetical protein n=1 Tax=Lactobacillus delbrueckii TaxID=1584 RepID=UPI003854EC0C
MLLLLALNICRLIIKVSMVGKKEKEELDYYYNICDIGIDSMGRHRSNVYYNSSLKGKEYLAKGLPIVLGVTTELDYIKDFRFITEYLLMIHLLILMAF